MNIRPASPEGPQRGTERLGDKLSPVAPSRGPAAPVPATPLSGADAVVLSSAARELLAGRVAEPLPVGTLSPQRLRQVLDRIQQGFYASPEVERATLQRMAADLGALPNAD
jgi:hypothetical protein